MNPAIISAIIAADKNLLRFRGTRNCLSGLEFSKCGFYRTYNPREILSFIAKYKGKCTLQTHKSTNYAIRCIGAALMPLNTAKRLKKSIITEAQFYNLMLENSISSLLENDRLESLNLSSFRNDLERLLGMSKQIPQGLLFHDETTGEILPGTIKQYTDIYGAIIALFLGNKKEAITCVEDFAPTFLANVRDGVYTEYAPLPQLGDADITTETPGTLGCQDDQSSKGDECDVENLNGGISDEKNSTDNEADAKDIEFKCELCGETVVDGHKEECAKNFCIYTKYGCNERFSSICDKAVHESTCEFNPDFKDHKVCCGFCGTAVQKVLYEKHLLRDCAENSCKKGCGAKYMTVKELMAHENVCTFSN